MVRRVRPAFVGVLLPIFYLVGIGIGEDGVSH
jgi:hypothetical protein